MNPSAEHRPTNALNRSACWLRTGIELAAKARNENQGGFHVHNSSRRADPDVAGRVADLAVQSVLGILPKRRSGTHRRNRPGPSSSWPVVNMNFAVDVCQSQKCVACPDGGNRLYPTICFQFSA